MIRFLQNSGKATKYILGGMLVLICGAMVITLVPGGMLGDAFGFSSNQAGVVARVSGQDVTTRDVYDTAQRIGKQQFGGRAVPPQLLGYLRQSAAEQLITQKALIAEADRMGLKVSDAELKDYLLKTSQFAPLLAPGGNFVGEDQYEMFVSNQFQMPVAQFEALLKQDLLMAKLRAAVEGPVSVSKADIEQEYARQNTKVKFDYAVVSLDDVMKSIKPTDEELKSYYDSHKATYNNSIPEKRQVKYALIDSAKFSAQVQVTPEELQRAYRENQDRFRVPEQVNVRHILIKTPLPGPNGKTDDAAVKAAKDKAEDVLKQLKAGGNFADLAKKYSDDPGSKDKGGELGWINRGQTVPEFEKTAFGLKKGETSGLVQSTYGFHIIQLEDKHDAHLRTLEEAKPELEPVLRQQKASAAIENAASGLLTQAKTQGLDKAAQSKGLDVITSNWITRTDTLPGVGTAPQLMDAIFSASAKSSPESAATPQGYVIFQVLDVKPPATPTFEEVRARVESDYKGDKAQQMLAQKTQELADKAKAEHDLKKAAQQVGASYKTSELVTLNSQVPEFGRMADQGSVAFTLNKGEISGPINTGRGGAVLMLTDKQAPSAEEMATGSEQTRQTLLEKKRGEAFSVFATGLRQRMEKDGKIKINKEEMSRLNSTSAPAPGE